MFELIAALLGLGIFGVVLLIGMVAIGALVMKMIVTVVRKVMSDGK